MKMKTKFYDTCSLLVSPDNIFQEENTQIAISSITFPNTLKTVKEFALDTTAWYKAQGSGAIYAGKTLY